MRPAGHGGAEVEQRVVQQHELAVGGQAAVRLEAVEWLLECAVERRPYARPRRWAYSAGSTPITLATQACLLVTSLQPSREEVVQKTVREWSRRPAGP
jgi:hypothetical protein